MASMQRLPFADLTSASASQPGKPCRAVRATAHCPPCQQARLPLSPCTTIAAHPAGVSVLGCSSSCAAACATSDGMQPWTDLTCTATLEPAPPLLLLIAGCACLDDAGVLRPQHTQPRKCCSSPACFCRAFDPLIAGTSSPEGSEAAALVRWRFCAASAALPATASCIVVALSGIRCAGRASAVCNAADELMCTCSACAKFARAPASCTAPPAAVPLVRRRASSRVFCGSESKAAKLRGTAHVLWCCCQGHGVLCTWAADGGAAASCKCRHLCNRAPCCV